LTLGGAVYPWGSPPIAWLFGVAATSLAIFLWVEAHARDAILPLHLFRIKAFSISTLASFVISMSFLGVVMFMPLYMQVVQGVSATSSGVALLPLMAGLILSSIVCGRLVSRTGRYKIFMIGGGVLLVLGVLSLTYIGPDTTPHDLAWRLALTGIGLGPAQSLFSVVITNSVPVTELGVATSASQFSRQIGSTVGVAIFGAFLTHSLTAELPKHLPLLPGATAHQVDLSNAQSQAMNVAHIRGDVEAAMLVRYHLVERAYQGDPAAVAQVLADEQFPESVKTPLRSGGVRTQVHADLLSRAAAMPADSREPFMRQEDSVVAETTGRSLMLVQAAMSDDSGHLVQAIQYGTKQAFSTSITQMLGNALWIVIVGVVIVLFIPELPLRSGRGAPTRVEV
jgi:hypothetical protein